MDLTIFLIICASLVALAVIGYSSGSIFALLALILGLFTSISLTIGNTIETHNIYSGGWKYTGIAAYPLGYLLVFLILVNFAVIVKRMRGL